MLALMPPTSALSDLHSTATKMSLAVLPSSPATVGQSSRPTLLPPTPPSLKRPRLSLNTANVTPIFGKNATSLRLETLSATSPTIRNTFQNTHSPHSKRPILSLKKPTLTPLTTNVGSQSVQLPETVAEEIVEDEDEAAGRPYSAASTSSLSTITTPAEAPYKLPFNATSILVNGPIPRSRYRRNSFSQTRPMFPTPKKVAFQAALTEDISTEKYTLRHSDIPTSTIELESTPSEDAEDDESVSTVMHQTADDQQPKANSPKIGDKRDSSDEEDSDTCPATPVAGRRKRHRQWRWTLDSVEGERQH